MQRREFIALLGSAAATWPLVARAQQQTMPVIGMLNSVSFDSYADRMVAFRQGLKEAGFVEGQNVAIEYRSAEGQFDRLAALAVDLAGRKVAVIVGIGTSEPARQAKVATSTIPIVFVIGADPIKQGLLASFNRPEANVTGVTSVANQLLPKRMELLRELLPQVTDIAFLVNPSNPNVKFDEEDILAAARSVGRQVVVFRALTEQDLDTTFAAIARQRIGGLMVQPDPLLSSRREQIVRLAARQALPVLYSQKEFIAAGGLMSYGGDQNDSYQQAGVYTGRILKGAKPADLPVVQPTRFELVINLKTAKTLGLEIPPKLLALADAVIE